MKKFEYFKANDEYEALELKEKHKDAIFLAGGTDLFIKMENDPISFEKLIDIGEISSLSTIEIDENKEKIVIGAACKVREIEKSKLIKDRISGLVRAAHVLGSPQVRNLATIGGNICNAAPSADLLPILMVLGAELEVVSKGGSRIMSIEDFFKGPGISVLKSDEMLKKIHIPIPTENYNVSYLKHSIRKSMDIAVVGVAASIKILNNKIEDCRIALGAVAPTPIRAYKAEEYIKNNDWNEKTMSEAAVLCREISQPIDDVRSSAEYRATLVEVLTKSILQQLTESHQGGCHCA